MTNKITPEMIKSVECKHVTFVKSQDQDAPFDDCNIAKLIIHTHDGQSIPVLKPFVNFKRPFFLVKKQYQNFTGRKEWEELKKLDRYESTQTNLTRTIAQRQGYGDPRARLNVLARNQYLFGADISTEVLIKANYMNTYKDSFTPNKVAVIDYETDMQRGTGEDPIIGSITMKDKAFIGVMRSYLDGVAAPIEQINLALKKYLGDLIEKRGIEFEIEIFDSRAEMVHQILQRAHQWKPDIVTYWNMLFDMEVMKDTLEAEGYSLARSFCDPSIPDKWKYFHLKIGSKTRETANGHMMNLANYERWHTVTAPAHFVHIDAMATYYQIRKAKGKEPSYTLDYTLKKHLGEGKLYITGGTSNAKEGSAEWHVDMQRNFKIEYIVYNVFDNIGVELLNEKTKDLETQISILTGFSKYSDFTSNPRVTADKLYFHCLNMETPHVTGCVSDKMKEELDQLLPNRDGWIVTLPAYMVFNDGMEMLEELPGVKSSVWRFVSDADIGSTYPNGEIIMNLSKQTTMMEFGKIKGVPTHKQQLIGINVTGGPANATMLAIEVLKAPTPVQLLEAYRKHKQEKLVNVVN